MSSNIFKELEKGSLPGLKRCISLYPSSVNLKNPAGTSPLHIAAGLGQAALVKELLVHGAQHDSPDNSGNIPLHFAAGQGSLETVVELLAGRKLTAKTKNRDGQTPLHLAVIGGHKAVVEKLLDAGVVSTVKDKAGNTPLSLADPSDDEMAQLLQGAKQASTSGSSLGTSSSIRGMELTPGGQRSPATSGMLPAGGNSGRITLPLASATGSGGGAAAGTPVTPTPRSGTGATPAGNRTPPPASHVNPQGARTPPPAPVASTGGAATNRLARSGSSASASPATSGGGAHSVGGAGPTTAAQLQKYDVAIQSLKEGLRAATERLGALDACTAAQLECAGQVEKALAACGNNSRAVLDLETRVAFQEERGRDARTRLERLEETERDRQDSLKRLADDHRNLTSQLHRIADQVASGGGAIGQRLASAGDSSSHTQALQAEVAVLRAQLDQIAPALALATAASAEVRTLAARVDVLQQQQQQQQQSVVPQHLGGSAVTEQQVLQLQAQVQLLQLPVASLSQQCADLSSRMTGLTEWQQQTRTELARLVEAADQTARNKSGTDQLSDAVMLVLDTTARTMTELRQQQDEMVKQIAMLQQQQQAAAAPLSPLPSSGPPPVPGTPTSASQRVSTAGDSATVPLGGPPSRNLNGQPSLGSVARDSLPQVELRSELESLKSLVADIRKEVVTEGGSLRREWQRAFSDMQSRYGEQANELRAREANIAKLREAALVEEAERRATSGYEEKFSARLGKLETNVEYLTHRLEVLEEQVSGMVSTLAGAASPVIPLSPSRMATALAAMRGQTGPGKSAPGPVSENHNSFEQLEAPGRTVAVAAAASAVPVTLQQGRQWSAGGPQPASSSGCAKVQSEGGCLRRTVGAGAPTQVLPSSPGCASGRGAPEGGGAGEPRRSRHPEDKELGPDEWWRAPDTEASERQAAGFVQPLATGDVTCGDVHAATPDAAGTAAARSQPLVNVGVSTVGAAPGQRAARGDSATPRRQEAAVRNTPNAAAAQQPQERWNALAAQNMGAWMGPDPMVQTMSAWGQVPPVCGPQPVQGQGLLEPCMAMPSVSAGVLDPANVALGPQLLTPVAQALLTPSVDIQRLAAAAAAQQEQAQQLRLSPQRRHFVVEPQASGVQLGGQQSMQQVTGSAVDVATRAPTSGPVGSGRERQDGGSTPSRKEPPLCLFCFMQ